MKKFESILIILMLICVGGLTLISLFVWHNVFTTIMFLIAIFIWIWAVDKTEYK